MHSTEPNRPKRRARRTVDRAAPEAHGVSKLFTLSGGPHLLDLRGAARRASTRRRGPRIGGGVRGRGVGEGDARAGRRGGHCRAGRPTRCAPAPAQQSQTPMVVLGGRAPALRWGQGSLRARPRTCCAPVRPSFTWTADSGRDPSADRRVPGVAMGLKVGADASLTSDGSRVHEADDVGGHASWPTRRSSWSPRAPSWR